MSDPVYRNEEYRDELIKFSYPFDEESTLENDQVFIGPDLLLDAILFFKEDLELPIYISEIDGASGETDDFSLILSDNTTRIVGRAVVTKDEEKVEVLDNRGALVGFLIVHQPGFQRFSRTISGKIVRLNSDVAKFSLDVCHTSKAPHLRAIVTDTSRASGDVKIVARHAVNWLLSEEGKLSLNVYADPLDSLRPVRSINGVENPSIWLTHHPLLNVRIVSKPNRLEFRYARDDT